MYGTFCGGRERLVTCRNGVKKIYKGRCGGGRFKYTAHFETCIGEEELKTWICVKWRTTLEKGRQARGRVEGRNAGSLTQGGSHVVLWGWMHSVADKKKWKK